MSGAIKLLPRVGMAELRFGDASTRAHEVFGKPTSIRIHRTPDEKRSSHFYEPTGLTLGFDHDERLDFIVARRGGYELWGEDPFQIANNSAEPLANVRAWLVRNACEVRGSSDSFDDGLSVDAEGVSFHFSCEPPGLLEGVQLWFRFPGRR